MNELLRKTLSVPTNPSKMVAIPASVFWSLVCLAAAASAQLERVDPSVAVPAMTVQELERASQETESAPRVIDVRLKEDFDADPVLIPDATWRDPNAIDAWAKELSPGAPVVVYCVRGHWVSQSVTKKLRDLGLEVSQLTGGIEAWKAAGKPTEPSTRP